MTTIFYDDIFLKHDTGAGHPENSTRLVNTTKYLESIGIWQNQDIRKPRAATKEEISMVHNIDLIERVSEIAKSGGGYFDPDTFVSSDSYDAAIYAVGALLMAVDVVMNKESSNAFCLVRPPGHHATPTRSMGFCLFNNVAIAAKYIQTKYNLERIVIIDWDVHHGNGTQDTFYEDPSVMYFSMHRSPFYPGTGSKEETGRGKGSGFTINVPLSYGTDAKEYIEIFDEIMEKRIKEFNPQFILISSGFDAYHLDPIGSFSLGTIEYNTLTRHTKKIAQECCEGRIVSCLEGGYHLSDLPKCIEEHIKGLNDK